MGSLLKYSPRTVLISLAFALFSCADAIPDAAVGPVAVSGPPLNDLSRVEFADRSVYLLKPRWDFYWKKLLSPEAFVSGNEKSVPVPDARFVGMRPWTTNSLENKKFPGSGYGTYRMLVRLPPGREYAFRFQQQFTAYRVYVDGVLKIEAGRVGRNRAESRPEKRQHMLYTRVGTKPVEIIVQVSNFHMYRGGLRGILAVGRTGAVDAYANRKFVLDLILIGFFISIFLYHLSFFFMHRRELYFLVFALFALGFAVRMPFISEKTIWLVYGGMPWEWFLRISSTINILSPAFFIIAFRTLYPEGVSLRAVIPYVVLALAFSTVHFFDIMYLAPVMYLSFGIVLPVLVHAGWITFRLALRGNTGALLMGIGVCIASIVGFYAMYLNWRAEDAAPIALFAMAGSILFQALGIGRTYRDTLTARDRLRSRLVRSRAALSSQRKELEINLHDSLGGALTDLRIVAERGQERLPTKTDASTRNLVTVIRERLDAMSRLFRGQLLFMEDMELATRDPVTGLHMTLLRRYSDAERELIFEIPDEARVGFEKSMRDDNWRLDMLQLARELCTNDLKYGSGESRWSVAVKGQELVITQSNATDTRPAGSGPPERARERAMRMGGNLEVRIRDGHFSMRVVLPLPE